VDQSHHNNRNGSVKPGSHTAASETASFFTQELKPIRFDPTRQTDIPTSDITSSKFQSTTRTDSTTSRIPFIRVPKREELPSTTRTSSQLATQAKNGSQTPSKAQVHVKVPPHPSQVLVKSKDVIRKLKQDVSYIREHPQEVSDYAGVLPFDDTPLDTKARRKARQKKHKKVSRNDLSLNLSNLSLKSSTRQATELPLVHPLQQARQILQERFTLSQGSNVTFENQHNQRQLSGKFQFVSDYIPRGKVKTRPQVPLPPRACQCIGGCGECCGCLTSHQAEVDAHGVQADVAVQPYRRRDDGLVVLSDEFVAKWSHKVRIFECGEFCSCPPTCVNRVVQKGRKVPLQIFETRRCGFGVRSSVSISRGQFIDLYLGEVITPGELEKREAVWEEDTPSYVLSLDVFITDEQKMYHVDGGVFGSVTRFVNHSCEPNCTVLPVVLSSDTKQIYHVAFFAIKDIPAGTELTIDYDPSLAGDDEALDAAVVQCRCGSAKCRKRLWRPGKEKRGRKRVLPSKDDD